MKAKGERENKKIELVVNQESDKTVRGSSESAIPTRKKVK